MEVMYEKPTLVRLSLKDSVLVTAWGKSSFSHEKMTEDVAEALTCYAVNAREFDILGPEIKYYLQFGLDKNDLDILRQSDKVVNTRVKTRSPDDMLLAKKRASLMRHVNNAFKRLKRDLFPQLTDKFIPPTINEDEDTKSGFIDDEVLDDITVDLDISRLTTAISLSDNYVRQAAIPRVVPIAMEPVVEPVVPIAMEPVVKPVVEPMVETAIERVPRITSFEEILETLVEIKLMFIGVVAVGNDVNCVIESFLRRNNVSSFSFTFPIVGVLKFDIFICMPSPDLQRIVLKSALNHPDKKPFFLYLPLSLLESDIDLTVCRLNLLITGNYAWFMGYHPTSAGVNRFRLRIIRE
jgi:hypothetical protein